MISLSFWLHWENKSIKEGPKYKEFFTKSHQILSYYKTKMGSKPKRESTVMKSPRTKISSSNVLLLLRLVNVKRIIFSFTLSKRFRVFNIPPSISFLPLAWIIRIVACFLSIWRKAKRRIPKTFLSIVQSIVIPMG